MRFRNELAETSRYEIEKQFLLQMEGAMAETGEAGLNAQLDAFWAAWKAGSTTPEELIIRADLLEKAKSLAGAFNTRVENLLAIQSDKNLAIIQRVDEINMLAEQIGRLNVKIGIYSSPGTQANDFLDERDIYIDRLAEIAGAKVYIENNGHAMVSIGGHVLVQGSSTHRLVTTPEPTNFNLATITWEDGLDFILQSGELAGLLDARDVVVVEQKQRLDYLAEQIAAQINNVHNGGYGLNESIIYDSLNPPIGAQRDFFTITDPLNPALSLSVNIALQDLSLIAFSQIDVPPGAVDGDTLTAASGDSRVAEAIFNLQNAAITYGDGKVDTFNHYNTMQVSQLGLKVRQVVTLATQHENLLQVLAEQRESVNGVSLDEEAANLIKYQRSYQAAIRLMTAVDEMLDRIINNLGLVGR